MGVKCDSWGWLLGEIGLVKIRNRRKEEVWGEIMSIVLYIILFEMFMGYLSKNL